MLNPHDYTVGWICALNTEYVAAQVFLDEEHPTPESVSPNDNSSYTLGKIGPHNVVIAVLPPGEYGLSSAAIVARDMLHSFPNIRIGLVVGIGLGAPSAQHDIRRGDVVVSTTVLQYDAGKAIQDEEFQYTKKLDQPPVLLRTAVSGLAAKYEIYGNRIHADVCEVLENRPKLREKKYGRPNLDEDWLFKSEVTHASQCGTTCRVDSTAIVSRTDRETREDDPVIHHGVIASADTLMDDAVCRDKLAARNNVLCFEREAAGLMNHFPCLVIRGISDYADSHQSKNWQGYAAMTAAAYAKDLLTRISPTRVEAERKTSEVLSEFSESLSRTDATVSVIKSQLESHEDRAILEWLSTEDYSSQHGDYINRREAGTGQWFLGASEFQEWVENSGEVLFCPGIPGAGKTILASTVIDYLQRKFDAAPSICVAYIYFNYKRHEMQRLSKVLGSLLRQLLINRQHIPQVVKEFYRQHKARNQRPSSSTLTEAIKQVTALYSRVFIVVDALDECPTADGRRGQFLSILFSLQAEFNANVLATSRALPEIVEQFSNHRRLEIRAQDEDIQIYLDGRIAKSRLPLLSSHQDLIKAEIMNVVDGMFLLAQLHYDTVSTRRTLRQIKDTFRVVPNGPKAYDQVYEEYMRRISGLDEIAADIARHVLLWITCAKRPLTTVEMQHALAVVLDERTLDEENILQTDDMVSACTGLITVDQQSGVIRLVHYTAQEYLQRTQHEWFPDADLIIAKHCITYLLFQEFEEGACASDEAFEARLLSRPLFNYAACNWGHHARSADQIILESLTLSLLENDQKRSAASQGAMASPGVRGYIEKAPSNVTALHLAAYFGLSHLVVALLWKGHSPGARDSHGRTPLSLAAAHGHSAVMTLLLATEKVDVNSQDNDGKRPVSWASRCGSCFKRRVKAVVFRSGSR
ncbi:purine and uridine phosphorylase [Aspergillus egyptiacus]|nr:purine and uridine phosphorylase [Aspergillus egyptiacus]